MGAIDLGASASFRLGAAEVHPSRCEVVGPGGAVALEPRVMQVLLALANAGGETVTRDQLLETCWGGRIVGDDAINRVIHQLRKLSASTAAGSFTIRTVHKLGYRLLLADAIGSPGAPSPARSTAAAAAQAAPRWPPVRAWAISAAVLGVAAAVAWVNTGRVRSDALPAPGVAHAPLDPAAADLALRGRAAVFEGSPAQLEQAVGYFRGALERSPRDADLWGALAMTYAFSAAWRPPAEQGFALSRAKLAAERALELDPHNGHALAAQSRLTATFANWREKEAVLAAATKKAQGSPAPIHHHARFLAAVGRTREAARQSERALQLNPLAPWLHTALVNLLAASGRVDEAENAAARASALWPKDPDLWTARYALYLAEGRPALAGRLAADKAQWPRDARPSDMELLAKLAGARARAGMPASASLDMLEPWTREGQLHVGLAMIFAAQSGAHDRALEYAEQLYLAQPPAAVQHFVSYTRFAEAGERPTELLFSRALAPLWGEARYWDLLRRIGLVDYWRSRGAWPDICDEPTARRHCAQVIRAEAG